MTYSVSRYEQRLISGAQLVKKSVCQFLTASPQFTYTVQHTLLWVWQHKIKYTQRKKEKDNKIMSLLLLALEILEQFSTELSCAYHR